MSADRNAGPIKAAARRLLLAGLACALALPAAAAFTDHGDGTITDTATGLMWDKCSWGQAWDSGTNACSNSGNATTHVWSAALGVAVTANGGAHRGHGDWRLPNRSELVSLVKLDASSSPLIDSTFPEIPPVPYWTSTTYAQFLLYAWYVYFADGSSTAVDKSAAALHVRLVRGGPLLAAFDAFDTTPDAFDIPDLAGQPLSTTVSTGAVTVAGIGHGVTASTSVGTLVKNGTDTGQATTSVANGDTLAVRLSTSGSLNTATHGTLTIGGSSDNFAVTTTAVPSAVNGACGAANGVATAFAPTALCAVGGAGAVADASPWTWSCAGSGGGTNAACSAPNQSTPSGGGRVVISGGAWTVDAPLSAGFIATSGHAKSPPVAPPPGYVFPHGLLDFTLAGGAPGSAATISLTYPNVIPAGAVYWKYGPSPSGYDCAGAACAAPHWYRMPAGQVAILGNTIMLTIVDGGVGDDDLDATNGVIVDAGGPGVPGGVADIPSLSEWGVLLLSLLLSAFAALALAPLRRRPASADFLAAAPPLPTDP